MRRCRTRYFEFKHIFHTNKKMTRKCWGGGIMRIWQFGKHND